MNKIEDNLGHYVRARLDLLTAEDLASMLNLSSTDTLASWRQEGRGPLYCRLGKSVFYRRLDVEAWVFEQRVKR